MRQLIAAAAVLLLAARAAAIEYELPIEIDSEDDLQELFFNQEISEETYNTLLELLRRGVDLAKADPEELYALPGLTLEDVEAIIKYREAAGGIPDPGSLVAAGVLTDEKIAAIAPFVIVTRVVGAATPALSGKVRLRTVYTPDDGRIPPLSLEAKATTLHNLNLALALVVTRNEIGDLRYDTDRDALSAEARATRLRVPKAYAHWKTPMLEVLAGSYGAGFAQQLTFDESTLYRPNGLVPHSIILRNSDLVRECIESTGELGMTPCPSSPKRYVTPDFNWVERLFGLAISARKLPTGDLGWFQLTGWGSAQPRDIYQYEIYDRAKCSDPTDDSDENCKAPAVYHRDPMDPTAPSPAFSYQTLPYAWVELLGGGNISWFAGRRTHVGVTGWGAKPHWLIGGLDLDFQEWSRFPRGGPYGAVGADAAYGASWYDLGVEVTRSFDGGPTGGDLGVLGRGTATWAHNELELSLRWYGRDFINPHTGAIAEPDEVDGQRARDELGARLRYGGKVTRKLKLRALADFWVQPSADIPKIRFETRADYTINRLVTAGLFARWSDKDLREGGHAQCYEVPVEQTSDGVPVPCKGQKIDLGVATTLSPMRKMDVKLEGQIRFVDDGLNAKNYPDRFRKDAYAWALWTWWMTDDARLRARIRYDRPDIEGKIADRTFLEHTLWAYLMLTYRMPRAFEVSGRYELRAYLNDDQRSYVRDPSPEHWLSLEVEARF